jgi:Mlc titration factor MtfA (ptsG expression regulator)
MSWGRWWQRLRGHKANPARIPQALWDAVLTRHAFLQQRPASEREQLRGMASRFLAEKEFTGAHGLQISDEMALAIAAQACLPVLHLGLHWYADFKGIVVHPGAMRAPREVEDEFGVVHRYTEELSGEAMPGGPVTLSWEDVRDSSPEAGYNLVIHEFAHKLDMRDGVADGRPPLPRALRRRWPEVMQASFDSFVEALEKAERFGGEPPWLDAYAATAPAEFFAVAREAYFVNRIRFAQEFGPLCELFDAFFVPAAPSGD